MNRFAAALCWLAHLCCSSRRIVVGAYSLLGFTRKSRAQIARLPRDYLLTSFLRAAHDDDIGGVARDFVVGGYCDVRILVYRSYGSGAELFVVEMKLWCRYAGFRYCRVVRDDYCVFG